MLHSKMIWLAVLLTALLGPGSEAGFYAAGPTTVYSPAIAFGRGYSYRRGIYLRPAPVNAVTAGVAVPTHVPAPVAAPVAASLAYALPVDYATAYATPYLRTYEPYFVSRRARPTLVRAYLAPYGLQYSGYEAQAGW